MHNCMLLENIWKGDIKAAQSRKLLQIKHLLGLILPLRIVCLSTSSAMTCSRIVSEETELLPNLPLGDVLVEELSINVPLGSMVVILKDQNSKRFSNRSDVSFSWA